MVLACDVDGTIGDRSDLRGIRFTADASFDSVELRMDGDEGGTYTFTAELRRSTGYTDPVEASVPVSADLPGGTGGLGSIVHLDFPLTAVSGQETFTLRFVDISGPGLLFHEVSGLDSDPCPDVEQTEENDVADPTVRPSDPTGFSVLRHIPLVVDDVGDDPDADTGDGVCGTAGGVCTLRAAIMEANAVAGANVIHFNIDGSGNEAAEHVIQPGSALPQIVETVTIDGSTQPEGIVVIDGGSAGDAAGLRLDNGETTTSSGSTIQGLVIRSFSGSGIGIFHSSTGNSVYGNVIHGNANDGIQIVQTGQNTIGGSDAQSNIIYDNANSGIRLFLADDNGIVGNVISGNDGWGVLLEDGASNTLDSNFIGIKPSGDGDVADPNTDDGVLIADGSDNTLTNNVVSGNFGEGVRIEGANAINNQVLNNYVGTDSSGTADIGNTLSGIYIRRAPANVIAGNVVSGNNGFAGIAICGNPDGCGGGDTPDTDQTSDAAGNIVEHNLVGTNATNSGPLGNTGHGVSIDGAPSTQVSDNTIANSGQAGVRIFGTGAVGNQVRQNSIHDNGGLGIDLGDLGVTHNDEDDGDTGPNNLINFPTLILSGDDLTADFDGYPGDLEEGTTVVIELFQVSSCDPSGFGEGDAFFAQQSATADAQGDVVVTFADLPAGTYTATTTAGGNTSEFSSCVTLEEAPVSGTVVLQHAVAASPTETGLRGRIDGEPDTTADLVLFTGSSCANGVLGEPVELGRTTLTVTEEHHFLESDGEALSITHAGEASLQQYVAASFGSGELSDCIIAGPDNDSWVRALPLTLASSATFDGFIDAAGRSRWYKFPIAPGAEVRVSLSDLPADYNLALFRDIEQVFARMAGVDTPEELTELSAEFAPDMFSPDMFSPDMFSPDMFSPDMFSPDMFSPDMYSPDMFSPDMFSPDMFSPDMFSPDMFSPENFVAAQIFSLIGFSGERGTADELIIRNTWNNTGNFYVRVSGRNAAFDTSTAFQGSVELDGNLCEAVFPTGSAPDAAPGPGVETVILWDRGRIEGTTAEKDALATRLQSLAGRTEVDGVVVDLSSNSRVQDLHSQADGKPSCVYAKNLVAEAIKDVVDSYRANNDLKYVVLVGDDHSIPFFRYGDQAGLAPELNYYPPVADDTTSQAALRLNYILGQDEYGSRLSLNRGSDVLPVPDLAVGRVVETAAEASGMIDAYLGDNDGVVSSSSFLATGYDFLSDAATAISSELAAGTGGAGDQLIDAATVAPVEGWTADELRTAFLDSGRHDLVFLAGHFSAFSSLAADYTTRMLTTEVVGSSVDMTNSIIFSAGCHSGYGIVDDHAIPLVTQPLDWAQAFSQKKATFIGGTGYQYGDTDFIEYSEEIYLNFAKELRRGSSAVSVGDALVRAKQEYLASTPSVHGLHRKSVVISTLFGLPMLSVDMAGTDDPPDGSIVDEPLPFPEDTPGNVLGTTFADVTVSESLTEHNVVMKKLADGAVEPFEPDDLEDVTATYYEGPDGVVANPGQPVMPLISKNVSVSNQVLRGVGFRGGTFTEGTVDPLTGAPTTEIRGVHSDFALPLFFPMRLTTVNYFAELTGTGGTQLHLTPAQHKASDSSTLRLYSSLGLRLYYSANTETTPDNGNTPFLAAPPTISQVSADAERHVQVRVVGDPTAGIQEVWITHTDGSTNWSSTDLIQDPVDSRLWTGQLPTGATAFIVQAVNGVGLVTMSDNFGQYYTVEGLTAPADPEATSLNLISPPTSGTFGDTIQVSATLTDSSAAVGGKTIRFSLGGSSRTATTDSDGIATASLRLVSMPGDYQLKASFAGDDSHAASSDSEEFTIDKAPTSLTIEPNPDPVAIGEATGFTAILTGGNGEPLKERTVFFTVTNSDFAETIPVITDFAGRAPLGAADFPPGVYTVEARFLGDIPIPGGTLALTDPVHLSSFAEYEYLVVYDPDAGFVTGGGWIDSPPGAYRPAPDLTGKASFGFVARYKKGQTTPDGNTQFQFRAADFNFHSVAYEWLTVAGARAQFKGTGTVNESKAYTGEYYKFFVVGIDGDLLGGDQPDAFRIKVWYDDPYDGEVVIYDNKFGEGDNSNASTELGGGSIVIHSGKK